MKYVVVKNKYCYGASRIAEKGQIFEKRQDVIFDKDGIFVCSAKFKSFFEHFFEHFHLDKLFNYYVEYNGEQWLVNSVDFNKSQGYFVNITSLKVKEISRSELMPGVFATGLDSFKYDTKTVRPEELRIVDFENKSKIRFVSPLGDFEVGDDPFKQMSNKFGIGHHVEQEIKDTVTEYNEFHKIEQKSSKYKVAKQDFGGENVSVVQGQILILKDSHYRDINNNRVCEPDSFYDINCLKDLEEILEKYDKVEYVGKRGTIVGRNIYKRDEQISSINIWVMFQYDNKLFINPCELKIIFDNKNKEQKPETMKEQLKNRKILTNGNKDLNKAVYDKLKELFDKEPFTGSPFKTSGPQSGMVKDINIWWTGNDGNFEYHYDCSGIEFFNCSPMEDKKELTLDELFKMQSEPQVPNVEVNGYKAKFHDDCVKFGCAEIDKDVFIDLAEFNVKEQKENYPESNREICGFKIGDGWFTLGQVEDIAKYYTK